MSATVVRPEGQAAGRRSTPWDLRHVIWNFAQRDLKAKYKNTILGWAWSLVVPLATVATYTLVFSFFFRASPPLLGNGEPGIFAVYFFVGLVPWAFLNISVQRGMGSLLGSARMLQKIYLPGYVPVLGTVMGATVQMLIEFGVMLGILLVLGNLSPVWLLSTVWLALYLPFVASLAVIMALFNVFVRDLTLMIGVVMQLLFFLTPIIYTIDMVPETIAGIPVRAIIEASPFAAFIDTLRSLVYLNSVPSIGDFLYLAAWSAGVLGLAVVCFRRWGRDLAERL